MTASAPRPLAPRPARSLRSRLRAAPGPPRTGQGCWLSCYQIKSARKGVVLRCIGTPSISGSPLAAPSAGTAALCIILEREPASRSLRRSRSLARSSWIQKIENNKKKPNQAAEVTVEAGPSASRGGFHRLAGPLPPPVLSLFQIPLISLSRVGAHPGLRRCCCSPGFFPLLPTPPASLPLPLHPSRAGRPGGRGHPGILIHSHCRNGRDVASRREARPSANPPTQQRAADPGRSRGPGAPSAPGVRGRAGPHAGGGASRVVPHPSSPRCGRSPCINAAAARTLQQVAPDRCTQGSFRGSSGGSGPSPRLASSPPLYSDQGAGKGGADPPGGRGCGALWSPRALSVPGFSPPDRARSVTRRFHPPLLLWPIPFPPRSPALALSPPRLAEAGPGTAGPRLGTRESRSARRPGEAARDCARSWRGAGPPARPRTLGPAAGVRSVLPPHPVGALRPLAAGPRGLLRPGPLSWVLLWIPRDRSASPAATAGSLNDFRPRAWRAAACKRTPGTNQRRSMCCLT